MVANGLVHISGLLPILQDKTKLNDKSFEEQTVAVLHNLSGILKAAGTDPSRLVSCRVYIVDIEQWGAFNKL
jgi:2-iminobutanoate/2-iminopropanoate deaminase